MIWNIYHKLFFAVSPAATWIRAHLILHSLLLSLQSNKATFNTCLLYSAFKLMHLQMVYPKRLKNLSICVSWKLSSKLADCIEIDAHAFFVLFINVVVCFFFKYVWFILDFMWFECCITNVFQQSGVSWY